ncbi:MAG: TRAP transporter substrate-binding protein [Candidatus Vecturithrix sp.]|jgi:tripartite ATP-independent transporter DctP family solute receptor|nr:TRAP transporter substrate-binding protein [Candidatus Vecturithrix sp.]
MKKIVSLSLCLLLIASVFSAFEIGAKKAAAESKITANIASTFPPGSPQDMGLNKFKDLVTERSGGRIEILIHPSNAMGDERQTFELLSQGSVEYGVLGSNDISTYFPKYYISEVPYVFSSQDDFWKFWNGPGKDLSAIIEKERGVRTDGVILRGARYLTANRPVTSVEEVKGLKMRLPPVKAWFKVWEHLGALPSNIAFGEVYMALKTGVVEAQENPPETILNYKFYEAQKYMIATEHIYSAARVMSSAQWWATLSKEDQDLLTAAMNEAVAYANDLTKDGDAQFVKELEKLGMTLIKIDKEAFKKAVQPVIDQLAQEEWDPDFYEKVKAALQ